MGSSHAAGIGQSLNLFRLIAVAVCSCGTSALVCTRFRATARALHNKPSLPYFELHVGRLRIFSQYLDVAIRSVRPSL